MNKRGFTLVELLAVIVVLGLIMTIVATKGFGAFNNSKQSINSLNEKALKEAINLLSIEIQQCEDETEDYKEIDKILNVGYDNCTGTSVSNGCECLKDKLKVPINTNLKTLIDNNLVEGRDLENINRFVILSFDPNNEYKGEVKDKFQFKSTNEGNPSTKSISTFEFTTESDGNISFDWIVSSETNFDKLIVKINNVQVLSKSGNNIKGSFTKSIENNSKIKIEFQYSKDGSVNKNNDNATISNFEINANVTNFSRVDNENYKFEDF